MRGEGAGSCAGAGRPGGRGRAANTGPRARSPQAALRRSAAAAPELPRCHRYLSARLHGAAGPRLRPRAARAREFRDGGEPGQGRAGVGAVQQPEGGSGDRSLARGPDGRTSPSRPRSRPGRATGVALGLRSLPWDCLGFPECGLDPVTQSCDSVLPLPRSDSQATCRFFAGRARFVDFCIA